MSGITYRCDSGLYLMRGFIDSAYALIFTDSKRGGESVCLTELYQHIFNSKPPLHSSARANFQEIAKYASNLAISWKSDDCVSTC